MVNTTKTSLLPAILQYLILIFYAKSIRFILVEDREIVMPLLTEVFSAVIIAMDLLYQRAGKMKKRIFLVSDAASSINDDNMDAIINQFRLTETKLHIMWA